LILVVLVEKRHLIAVI